MEKVVFATLVFLAVFVTVHGSDTKIVQEFCEFILMQSRADTTQCFEKPRGYTFNGDKAILIFLCCLCYFGDVTHNYIPYLSFDLIQYIAEMTSNKFITNVAKFVIMCKNSSRTATKADFIYWSSNGKTAQLCRAN
uniref:Uncharacterized protein n=1 Tax=Arion vulgaris TaxID=1028688 RepID=A0A0B6ZG81_9EUPU